MTDPAGGLPLPSTSGSTQPAAAPMEAFIRLRIVTCEAEASAKMMAISASATWGAFQAAAVLKMGVKGEAQFLWQGCCIEEPLDMPVGLFIKDGDTLTLRVPKDEHACASQEAREAGDAALTSAGASEGDAACARVASGSQASCRQAVMTVPVKHAMVRHIAVKLPAASRDYMHGSSDPDGMGSDGSRPAGSVLPEPARLHAPPPALPVPLPRTGSQGDGYGRQNSHGETEKKCTCKHSKCIKLYCICWAAGIYCNSCMCQDCYNRPENEDFVRQEQSRIRSRNPNAFSGKVEQRRDGEVKHKIGCRCRRSQCIKKYCECFDGGVRCSINCRCIDCYNKPEGEGEDGLASLASAAQLASSCLGGEDALYQLTPGTAAAVAPYSQQASRAAAAMSQGNASQGPSDSGGGEPYPSRQGYRSRPVSDSEEGSDPQQSQQQAVHKKRRSSSHSSTTLLAAAAAAPLRQAAGVSGMAAGAAGDGLPAGHVPGLPQIDRPPAWSEEGPWAAGSAAALTSSMCAPGGIPWPHVTTGAAPSLTWPGSSSTPHQRPPEPLAGPAPSSSSGDAAMGMDSRPASQGVAGAAVHSGHPSGLPRPTPSQAEGSRAWAAQAGGKIQAAAMQAGSGILHHLQQQQQQMEAILLQQQQQATMAAMAAGAPPDLAQMHQLYPHLGRQGFMSYVMCSQPGTGNLMMMPMLNSSGSLGSQTSTIAVASPRAIKEEPPAAAVRAAPAAVAVATAQ